MKKIYLTAATLMAMLHSYAQSSFPDTGYTARKLKVEEVNLVSSYYHQDGDNAAVTGGIGSEKLTDISNSIDVKLIRYDRKNRKHSYLFDLGIDHYTSASSDMIDLKANSSASHADTRVYPSVGWTMENEAKGSTIGAGVSASKEFDYLSLGGNVVFAQKTKNHMGEFTAKLQAYLDQVSLVTPIELRTSQTGEHEHYPTKARNTYTGSFSYSQIINERLQMMFLADVVQQKGYLSLPFHRVYFTDGSVHQEQLPGNRFKLPIGFRGSYFLGDNFILRGYYRYYTDNWGIHAHTAELEVPVKISPFFSVSPFYRYYQQSAARYFAGYQAHQAGADYYTSNYDLSKFTSQFMGAGIHFTPTGGVFGFKHLNTLELRYGHYYRSTKMNSNIISLNLKFK